MANRQKNNNGMVIGIVVALVVLIAVIVGVVVGTGGGGEGDLGEGQTGETVETGEYDNVDQDVAFGDYETMEGLAKEIQNGNMTGQIIRIDGIVSHPMSKYSVVEESETGSKIGTEFVIDGVDESEYPEDGERVIITGKVVEKEPLYFVIKALPRYVDVLEIAE